MLLGLIPRVLFHLLTPSFFLFFKLSSLQGACTLRSPHWLTRDLEKNFREESLKGTFSPDFSSEFQTWSSVSETCLLISASGSAEYYTDVTYYTHNLIWCHFSKIDLTPQWRHKHFNQWLFASLISQFPSFGDLTQDWAEERFSLCHSSLQNVLPICPRPPSFL